MDYKLDSEPLDIRFQTIPHFDKLFEKLQKKYHSLPKDFELFKKSLCSSGGPRSIGWMVELEGLGKEIQIHNRYFLKAKKFHCKELGGGGNSGIRVIFCWYPEHKKIMFLEIYHKNERENHDITLVKSYAANDPILTAG